MFIFQASVYVSITKNTLLVLLKNKHMNKHTQHLMAELVVATKRPELSGVRSILRTGADSWHSSTPLSGARVSHL